MNSAADIMTEVMSQRRTFMRERRELHSENVGVPNHTKYQVLHNVAFMGNHASKH